MEKIKKDYNLRIVLIIVTNIFLLNSTAYGVGLYTKGNLRVPLLSWTNRQSTDRLLIQINSFDPKWFKEAADLFERRIPASGTSLFTWQYYNMPGTVHLMATDIDNHRFYGVITGKPDIQDSRILKVWGLVIDESLEEVRKEYVGLRLLLAFLTEAWKQGYTAVEAEVMPSLIRLARQYLKGNNMFISTGPLRHYRIPVRIDLETNKHLFKAIEQGDISLEEIPFSSLRAKLLRIKSMGLQEIEAIEQVGRSL